jgi:uncharacterized cupredoxin-like copper-binding protein
MKMTSHLSRSLTVALAVGATSLVLAACGSSSSSSSSTSAPAGGSGGSSGTTVPVGLKDFSITMPKMAMSAGTYTFVVTNSGPSAHNLTITGPGLTNTATPTFPSGTKKLTVTLENGTYDFFCSVPGHKAAGMNVNVTVGGGAAASTSSGGASSGGSSSSGGGWS